jgi:hypothetical protein
MHLALVMVYVPIKMKLALAMAYVHIKMHLAPTPFSKSSTWHGIWLTPLLELLWPFMSL